jgi:hypothetical protein
MKGSMHRITPAASLFLTQMLEALDPEVVRRFVADGSLWAMISTLASYSPLHVMLLNVERRYVPGPESLSAAEGNRVLRVAARFLEMVSGRSGAEKAQLGFNWSPYGLGPGLEEQGGWQSIITKFHLHCWVTWALPEEGKISEFNVWKTDWVREEELSPQLHRLLIKNDYGAPLGRLLAEASRAAMDSRRVDGAVASVLRNERNWCFDARGAAVTIPCPLLELLTEEPKLFENIIQPVARACSDLLCRLTEIFTDMDCVKLHRTLAKVESGPLPECDIAELRAVPKVRAEGEIRNGLKANGWPLELIPVLLPAIENRCLRAETSEDWQMWRKGFGYAFLLSGALDGCSSELRLMPGVYLGPGGVVESQRMVLSRVPVPAPEAELVRRSRMLTELSRWVGG